MNRFNEGQKVVCISEKFPLIASTLKDGMPNKECVPIHPIKGETLVIDEMLGEFLRFEKYDSTESFNWWHCSRFKPLDEIAIEWESVELYTKKQLLK